MSGPTLDHKERHLWAYRMAKGLAEALQRGGYTAQVDDAGVPACRVHVAGPQDVAGLWVQATWASTALRVTVQGVASAADLVPLSQMIDVVGQYAALVDAGARAAFEATLATFKGRPEVDG